MGNQAFPASVDGGPPVRYSAGTFAYNPDNSDEAGATGLLAWRNAWDIPEMSEETLAAVVENDTEATEKAREQARARAARATRAAQVAQAAGPSSCARPMQ